MSGQYVTFDFALEMFKIKRATLYKWIRQGKVKRYPEGLSLDELLTAEKSRDINALLRRGGIKKADYEASICRPGKVESTHANDASQG